MSLVVRGPSLALRYATPDDASALYELGRDEEVVRWFSWGPYRHPSAPLDYIASVTRQRETGERLEFVIVDATDTPVGVTGLSDFSLRDRRAIVGTWLGTDHWGTGANTESKALILQLAFDTLGLQRVSALTDPANARSLKALEKLGFEEEGVLRSWHVHGDDRKDTTILRLLKEDFETTALASVPTMIEGAPPKQFLTTSD